MWCSRMQPPLSLELAQAAESLVDVSDISFFCSEEGEGESGAPGGEGDDFLLKIPGGGAGGPHGMGGEARGREGVCGEFGEGGGAKYFFSGPKFPPREASLTVPEWRS